MGLVLMVIIIAFFVNNKYDVVDKIFGKEQSPIIENGINYGPPTEEEKASADQIKEEIKNTQQTTNKPTDEAPGNTSPASDISLVITDATQYDDSVEVRAFVPNHLANGTCVYNFTYGSTTLTKQSSALTDASTTICANLEVPRSEFAAPGKWLLEIIYTGNDGKTAKATQEIEIK